MPPWTAAPPSRRNVPALVAMTAGAVLVVGGAVVLLGWWIESPTLVQLSSGLPSMRANAALFMVLLGVSIVLVVRGRTAAAIVLAALAGLLPLLDVVDWVLGRDVGVDLFLFRDQQARLDVGKAEPGRLSPGATVVLLSLSVAVVLLRRMPRTSHAVALLGGVAALLGVTATAYGSGSVPRVEGSPGVALHGAVLGLVAAVGVLALQPDTGLVAQLREPGRIGTLVRQFTVVAVALPFVVGGLGMLGIRSGRYEAAFAVALVATAWTGALLLLVWWGGRNAVPVERQGDLSRDDARESRDRLALLADVSNEFAATPELDETLDRVTRRIAATFDAACAVRLIDPTGTWLVPATAHHPDPGRQAALERMLDRSVRIDQGIAGEVLRTGVAGVVERLPRAAAAVAAEPELVAALDAYGQPSAIVAGLRAGGRAIGVVTVLRDEDRPALDQDDLDLVIGLADRAAQAIHNGQRVAGQLRRDAAFAGFAADALVTHDPRRLRAVAVEHLAEALEARHAVLLEPEGDDLLRVTATTLEDGRPGLPVGTPVTTPVPLGVLRTGDPYVCADMRNDVSADMAALAGVLGADSGLAVVVPGRERSRGVLTVVAVGAARFSDDEVDLARAFAGLVSGALHRMEAEEELAEVAEERGALLDRLVSAQEDERARIADGVHQDQVQVIAAADLRLGVLARRAGELDPALAEDVRFARDAVSGAADRLRALLFELEPPDPTAGLEDSLAEAAAYLLDPIGTAWSVESASSEALTPSHRTTAYRIAKEALANAARHANARSVSVRITDQDGGILVRVVDDGAGMSTVPLRSAPGHLGMSSMRDWVEVAGGRLDVTSARGAGTTVMFWLPADP